MAVDYIPSGGGPQQAQRIGVTVGDGGRAVAPAQASPEHEGLSTGTKIAIGVGAAAALFGCYEMGCFSKRKPVAAMAAAAGRLCGQQQTAARGVSAAAAGCADGYSLSGVTVHPSRRNRAIRPSSPTRWPAPDRDEMQARAG